MYFSCRLRNDFFLVPLSVSHSPSFWLSCCFLPVSTSFLAHDIEEDELGNKFRILPWALGRGGMWQCKLSIIMRQRDQLWSRMNFRAIVSRIICEEVERERREIEISKDVSLKPLEELLLQGRRKFSSFGGAHLINCISTHD